MQHSTFKFQINDLIQFSVLYTNDRRTDKRMDKRMDRPVSAMMALIHQKDIKHNFYIQQSHCCVRQQILFFQKEIIKILSNIHVLPEACKTESWCEQTKTLTVYFTHMLCDICRPISTNKFVFYLCFDILQSE